MLQVIGFANFIGPLPAHDVYARPAPEPPGTGDGPATVAPE